MKNVILLKVPFMAQVAKSTSEKKDEAKVTTEKIVDNSKVTTEKIVDKASVTMKEGAKIRIDVEIKRRMLHVLRRELKNELSEAETCVSDLRTRLSEEDFLFTAHADKDHIAEIVIMNEMLDEGVEVCEDGKAELQKHDKMIEAFEKLNKK